MLEQDILRLKKSLALLQPLSGCHRRNIAERDREPKYSLIKGNAILLALGAQKVYFTTPVGPSEHFRLGDKIVTFRAGSWQMYWAEDVAVEVAVVAEYSTLKGISNIGLIAWENKGELSIVDIDASQFKVDPSALVTSYTTNGRMTKSNRKALRVCPNCPIKARCDTYDITLGQTLDWHAKYPR